MDVPTDLEACNATTLRDRIEDAILTGTYAPGHRLDEASLANRFNVSRTPVREALRQLSAGGLVDHRPNRGAIVSAPDPLRLIEMFEVMAELEALCGRLAARRADGAAAVLLREALDGCEDALGEGDPDAYYYANERFHRALYAASGSEFLAEQALLLHKRLAAYRRLQLRARNRLEASQGEHRSILETLLAGDPERTAALLRNHVRLQGERFVDLAASLRATRDKPSSAA